MKDSHSYGELGVSSAKTDVLEAVCSQDEGLFPGAFCKILPDVMTGDPDWCMAAHADGAGTKALVAYLMFRETGDAKLFAGLAQDALVMNVDDLLCIGARGPFVVTNTIGRNRSLVPGEAIEAIIRGYDECARMLGQAGVEIALSGGETADLGDIVRTLVVDAAVVCRLSRSEVLDGTSVRPEDLIVGLSSVGRAEYEDVENSGIGSNGLTLARHVLLRHDYLQRYPETCAPELAEGVAYRGPFALDDRPEGLGMTVGEALLSPTRSYAPVIAQVLSQLHSAIHGIVHCTGGGQTKCLRFFTRSEPLRFIKDDLLELPPLFRLIREAGGLEWSEMFQVFNMGHRMELFVDPAAAFEVIDIARSHGIAAHVIGRCASRQDGPRLVIEGPDGPLAFG